MSTTTTNAASERSKMTQRYKRKARTEAGSLTCEACGWKPPLDYWHILHAHHVVPVSCGGNHEDVNLAVLCPNCHAIAHALFPHLRGRYYGPAEKAELLAALRQPAQDLDRKGQAMVTHLLSQLLDAPP